MRTMTYAEASKLMEDEGCTCSIGSIRERGGHHWACDSRKAQVQYTTASYTYQDGTSKAGVTVTGKVVKQGTTYADVIWEDGQSNRVSLDEKNVRFQ